MKQAIAGLFGSKKAIVYVVTVGVMAAVMFGGVEAEHASDFIDKLSKLAMAYLGGQGLADLGKYAGAAYRSGKKAIDGRDPNASGWQGRVDDAVAAGGDAGDAAEGVVEEVKKTGIPAPPKLGG